MMRKSAASDQNNQMSTDGQGHNSEMVSSLKNMMTAQIVTSGQKKTTKKKQTHISSSYVTNTTGVGAG